MNPIRLSIGVVVLWTVSSSAAVIGLVNTGTAPGGALLNSGSAQPGWRLTEVDPANAPGGLMPPTLPSNAWVVPANQAWVPDAPGDVSRWISYRSPIYVGDDIYREYTYELPFQAGAGDDFYMRVAADNGTHVYLNQATADHELFYWGSLNPNNWTPFNTWSPWFRASDLLDGDNTLICVVANLEAAAQVTGLRVEFGVTGEGSGTGGHPVPDSGLPVWLAGMCFGIPLAVQRLKRLRVEG